jgi:dihydropyrimidinase
MGTTLIKNGTLITAEKSFPTDLLIVNEKIARVGENLEATEAEIVDAGGKFVLPGGIDPHVHLDLAMFVELFHLMIIIRAIKLQLLEVQQQ